MFDVAQKVAVITGGSSGIGRGIALALARAGAHVVALGRSSKNMEETQELFDSHELEIDLLQADVTDLDRLNAVAEEVVAKFGRIDILVNNAGIGLTGPVMEATADDWRWVVDVNILGVGNSIQAFVPKIREHGEGGVVVNTSSMGGLMPVVAGLYSMTKAGVIALSEALHIELAEENITVSAYCPGPVHSNIALAVGRRPSEYGESGYKVPPPEFAEFSKNQPYMSAEEAGQRVLQGIQRRDMFILTHPEFKAGVAQRHSAIEKAFPDEPINTERRDAIGFLLSSEVYQPENLPDSPVFAAE